MRKSTFVLGALAGLAACGQSSDEAANQAAVKAAAAAKKPKPAYCFFKDPDTKAWKASRDKAGNVVVHGKAFRLDPRYKAVLQPAVVSGAKAEVSPTVAVNDTGFASPDNWWDVTQTIPASGAVDTVTVKCGSRALAELTVPPRK